MNKNKKTMKNKFLSLLLIVFGLTTLSGCSVLRERPEEKVIISDSAKYAEAISKSHFLYTDLVQNHYYVWSNSKAESIEEDVIADIDALKKKYEKYSDPIFTPVYFSGATFAPRKPNETQFGDSSRLTWFTDEELKKVPVLKNSDKIVFTTKDDIPRSFIFEKFKNLGYSFGFSSVSQDENTGFYSIPISESNFYRSSTVSPLFFEIKQRIKDKEFSVSYILLKEIIDLNEDESTEKTETSPSVDPKEKKTNFSLNEEFSVIEGLRKNGKYRLETYYGSIHSPIEAYADTNVFASQEEDSFVTYEFKLIESTLAVIDVSQLNLTEGLYFLNGVGFFYFIP